MDQLCSTDVRECYRLKFTYDPSEDEDHITFFPGIDEEEIAFTFNELGSFLNSGNSETISLRDDDTFDTVRRCETTSGHIALEFCAEESQLTLYVPAFLWDDVVPEAKAVLANARKIYAENYEEEEGEEKDENEDIPF